MKTLVLLTAALLVADRNAYAEDLMCALGSTSASYLPLLDQPPAAHASRDAKHLQTLLCPKGCGQIGVFKNGTSPNLLTMNVGKQMSKVVYSQTFLDTVGKEYGSGATLGVLAHEIGHHVDQSGVTAEWMNGQWGNELRADAWAGCALARTKIKAQELKSALQVMANYPSAADPAWDVRFEVLRQGFQSCGGANLAALEARKPGVATRGCASDTECKGGRVCFDGRCQDKSARNACSKDVECPGFQVCGAQGWCDNPTASVAGTVTASLEKGGRLDPERCRARCGDQQEACSSHADRAVNACKRSLVADPKYKECQCPRWPTGRPDCYQVCKDTYQASKSCEASSAGDACLAAAASCASSCQ